MPWRLPGRRLSTITASASSRGWQAHSITESILLASRAALANGYSYRYLIAVHIAA